MGAGPWIESEDDVLRREYARQCIDSTSSTIRWDAIAHHLPGRTSRDVRKRWVNVLQNQFNKGAWTKDEDHRLRVAVQQYGTRWVSVAKDVDTRSADQCSKRWNQHLDPALVHSQWTEDEIELLFRAVSFHGTNWSTIQQVHFPRCPSNNIKNQHAIVSRNYDRLQGVLASISDAIPCCQNRGSSSQSSTPLSPKLMLPMSDNNLPNTQSLPWSPAPSEPACEYDTTGLGLHRSEYSSSQLDVLCSSLLSESNSTYSTLFDPLASEEITDTSGSLDQDVSLADSATSALMPREVSLIIRNPNENLVTYLVQQLVTAKVDFKVVQRSN